MVPNTFKIVRWENLVFGYLFLERMINQILPEDHYFENVFLLLFFQKKSKPAWQGTQSYQA